MDTLTPHQTTVDETRPARGASRAAWARPALVGLISAVVIVLRRPDALLNPQFWAEDGAAWFYEAYVHGIRAVLTPHSGYLQTSSRLVAWLAQGVPITRAPLVFSLFAIAMQALPAVLLATHRFDDLVPDWRARTLLIALYLLLPNTAEVHAILTNGMWHLALVPLLLAFARPPASRPGKVFDVALVLIAGLSGPFSILLAPFLALFWWRHRQRRWLGVILGADVLAAAIQVGAVVSSLSSAGGPRSVGLPTNLPLVARAVGSQTFAGLALGQRGYAAIWKNAAWQSGWTLGLVLALGLALVVAACLRGPWELRILFGYSAAIVAAGIVAPLGGNATQELPKLLIPGFGQRYFLVAMLGVGAALVWLLTRGPALRVVAAVALGVIAVLGIRLDFRYPAFADLHYERTARACLRQAPGTDCHFVTNPDPADWFYDIPAP